jgi:hypothetical protein
VILVVSHARDAHARAVLAALRRRGALARLLDLSRFPRRLSLTLARGNAHRPRARSAGAELAVNGWPEGDVLAPARGPPIRLSKLSSIWWRRPLPFVLHDEVEGEDRRIFAWREGREAFAGLWQSLPSHVRWVNHPVNDEAATHKPWQLAVAARVGLEVPRTLITSDPRRARAFLAALQPRRAVFKALSATPADWRPTRLVGAEHLPRLDVVRFAPVIFQEYVEPGEDVRVTVVGRSLFAASIRVADGDDAVDFRPVLDGARVVPTRLPASVASALRRLVAVLGLAYAAIDLRRDRAGRWFFLEANPSGQWLFVEERTGQPVTDALAQLLANGR